MITHYSIITAVTNAVPSSGEIVVADKNFKSDFPSINYFTDWRSCVTGADVCAVMTEWNEFRGIDLNELKSLLKYPRIFDAKNIYSIEKLKLLEFKFENIGRNF